MKPARTNTVIIISSVALMLLLGIQVNWIIRSARMKENLFNEKANLVLAKATEVLASDQVACGEIKACLDENEMKDGTATIGKNETDKIDSLLKHYMEVYNLKLNYSFVVMKPGAFSVKSTNGLSDYIYRRQLEEVGGAPRIELKLVLPEKRQFIVAEMGPLFFTSVGLILVVLALFWQTSLSLIREKEIASQTTDFLNNMTHEFKTPLTNIKLAGTMIARKNAGEKKVDLYSEIILSENEKLRLRVDQVLGMSALERGDMKLQPDILDMHQLITHVATCMGVQLDEKQGKLMLELDAEEHNLNADKTHIENVLCNLIDNAIKYSPAPPELTIRTGNRNHYLVVAIEDKGTGIPEQYRERIFDKFFRVPSGNVHDVKGFGLGLTYVKKIIELHGGSAEVQSELNKGTIFSLILPYA